MVVSWYLLTDSFLFLILCSPFPCDVISKVFFWESFFPAESKNTLAFHVVNLWSWNTPIAIDGDLVPVFVAEGVEGCQAGERTSRTTWSKTSRTTLNRYPCYRETALGRMVQSLQFAWPKNEKDCRLERCWQGKGLIRMRMSECDFEAQFLLFHYYSESSLSTKLLI